MSSIIEGYNYDIFISYRQKDNKGGRQGVPSYGATQSREAGWVTEFVSALKDELDATFKENISIYYDENPHDGLLETHDVDASLKEKMKCIVFIPIISRTYCDPKAFAWEHEFMAFVQQASADQFGLKVTLPSGNVATRVLPIRIHDLSVEDTRLVESVLGGIMRGVDFIYKSPGVNRPLRANEDHPHDNQNKTYFRDQINKVANAVSDIIYGLKYGKSEDFVKVSGKPDKEIKRKIALNDQIKNLISTLWTKRAFIILVTFLGCALAVYLFYKNVYLQKIENKIAVFRLRNTFNDSTLMKPAADFVDAVNQKLNQVSGISNTPSILTDKYNEGEKSFIVIRKELKTGFVLGGKIKREKSKIEISVELSSTGDDKVLWAKSYLWNNELESKISSEIVRVIADRMNVKIKPEEEKSIELKASVNPDLNIRYISANANLKNAWDYYNYEDRLFDSTRFKLAIEEYGKIINAEPSALAYARRAIAIAWGYYVDKLDSTSIDRCRKDIEKAMSLDKSLADIDIAWGFYYYYCVNYKEDPLKYEEALKYFGRASEKDPGNYQPLLYISLVMRRMGKWDECLKYTRKVLHLNPKEALFLTNIGMTYSLFHKYDSALIFHQKAVDQMPAWAGSYKNKFEALILKNGITREAGEIIDESIRRTGDNMKRYRVILSMDDGKYDYAFQLAESARNDEFDFEGEKYLLMAKLSSTLGNSLEASRYYESARVILSQALKKNPEESKLHAAIGLAYAGLGNKTLAIEEAEKSIQITNRQNKMDETDMKVNIAQIYTLLGDYDNAFATISYLLNNPSFFSKELLMIDPVWKPLINKPEYKRKIREIPN